MKTTLNIDEGVYRRLKEEAARRGQTISALVESALRSTLEEARREEAVLEPLPTFASEGYRVDVANREALYEVMARD